MTNEGAVKKHAREMFDHLTKAIKNVASKADILLFDSPTIKDRDQIYEDVIILHCFFTGVFHRKSIILSNFIERDFKSESKSKRKETGSYFTPPYIAEYICKETLGPLIERIQNDKKIEDKIEAISKLGICDPAMGGGIFLICAQDYIMERMIRLNSKYSFDKMAELSVKTLYGVDINKDAVRLSKLLLNINTAKWKMTTKFLEYANFAEKHLI